MEEGLVGRLDFILYQKMFFFYSFFVGKSCYLCKYLYISLVFFGVGGMSTLVLFYAKSFFFVILFIFINCWN